MRLGWGEGSLVCSSSFRIRSDVKLQIGVQ